MQWKDYNENKKNKIKNQKGVQDHGDEEEYIHKNVLSESQIHLNKRITGPEGHLQKQTHILLMLIYPHCKRIIRNAPAKGWLPRCNSANGTFLIPGFILKREVEGGPAW